MILSLETLSFNKHLMITALGIMGIESLMKKGLPFPAKIERSWILSQVNQKYRQWRSNNGLETLEIKQ